MEFGINLSFAPKRWPEPEAWARIVREDMHLDLVQFSFDLLDPWWPDPPRLDQAERVRRAAESFGITIHSAQIGIAKYTFNGLLHPDPALRAVAVEWWERAIEVTAALGAGAVGGPLGALTASSAAAAGERERIHEQVLDAVEHLSAAMRCRRAERAPGRTHAPGPGDPELDRRVGATRARPGRTLPGADALRARHRPRAV